ncbi:minor capsid protein [Lactococcus lactis]|uniref:minor capsid protein n=1 Tax=Lactococcus lactis TaxID=1358 RepID=UPI0024169FDB|nr:minor capsid protein [Lactococcus lactis]MDG4985505.1 minor capsid protein [Lactococcus lactis]
MANAKVDLRGAQRKLSGPNITRGRVAMANRALMDMDPFVPKRDHNLAASGHVTDSGKSIEYNTPYARAQFYGKSFKKCTSFTFKSYTTPGTGSRWDLKAKGLYGKSWPQVFKKGAEL